MEIRMPRLGVNDDAAILVAWLVDDGASVEAGQEIASLETSKTSAAIEAPQPGIVHFCVSEGDEVSVGKTVAILDMQPATKSEDANMATARPVTAKARRLAELYHLDLSLVPGDAIIREKDVLPLLPEPQTGQRQRGQGLLVLGATGFAKIAIDIVRSTQGLSLVGIVDMKYPNVAPVMGLDIVGGYDALERLYADGCRNLFNAMSDKQGTGRAVTYEMARKIDFSFPNIIHPSAILEKSAILGNGNLVCAGAIIGSEVRVGNDCIINAGSIISHDTVLGDHCNIASGAVLAGGVTVGENTLVGQNVSVYMGVRIGKNVTIQNGCSVFRNVPDNAVVRYGL